MDLGFQGKVALVTGAGNQQAVGEGIVRKGCDIVAADKDFEGVKQTVAEIEALGRKAVAIKTDLYFALTTNAPTDSCVRQWPPSRWVGQP